VYETRGPTSRIGPVSVTASTRRFERRRRGSIPRLGTGNVLYGDASIQHPTSNITHQTFPLSSECAGFARDPAKVEDQVQFLARTFGQGAGSEEQGVDALLRAHCSLLPDAGA
jgi:hypothetical protein